MAYFFVPLPEPLALPDGFVVRLAAPTSGDMFRVYEAGAAEMPPLEHTAGSLMFHRATWPSPQADAVNALFELANKMLPDHARASTSAKQEAEDGALAGS